MAQVGDVGAVGTFGGDVEHPGDETGMLGVAERREAEQRVDGCQSGVARGHTDAPDCFEVVQERADGSGVERFEHELAGSGAGGIVEVRQQEPERAAVGADGVGAGVALGYQPFTEEGFKGGGQRGHEDTPIGCNRAAAEASSSGEADRYQ